jgi:hypothetical protein
MQYCYLLLYARSDVHLCDKGVFDEDLGQHCGRPPERKDGWDQVPLPRGVHDDREAVVDVDDGARGCRDLSEGGEDGVRVSKSE